MCYILGPRFRYRNVEFRKGNRLLANFEHCNPFEKQLGQESFVHLVRVVNEELNVLKFF